MTAEAARATSLTVWPETAVATFEPVKMRALAQISGRARGGRQVVLGLTVEGQSRVTTTAAIALGAVRPRSPRGSSTIGNLGGVLANTSNTSPLVAT